MVTLHLSDDLAVVECCQRGRLLVSVPTELAVRMPQCRVARTLIDGAAEVGSVRRLEQLVVTSRQCRLVDHGHDGDAHAHAQSEAARETQESHDREYRAAERNVTAGVCLAYTHIRVSYSVRGLVTGTSPGQNMWGGQT